MVREKKKKVVFIPPPDDHCFICRKPETDPPGWHCQNLHTRPYRYPWEMNDDSEGETESGD